MVPNGDVKLIQLGSIGLMRYIDKGFKYLTEDTFRELSCVQIFSGYMLINRIISDKMYACILPQLDGKLITTVDTCWIAPKDEWYNLKYLMYFISSTTFQSIVLHVSSGTTRKRISKSDLIHLPICFPPLSEQQRIVSRIEELFAQIDIIDQNQADIDNLYEEFRKRTLTLAIQGKLVPQDPNDEPASVLLERIRAEKKAKLGKKYVDSYIYKGDDNCYYEKVGEIVTDISNEIPFDIPNSWCWARLKDITHNHGQKIPNAAFSYIDIGSIDNINQKLSAQESIIEPEKAPSRARKIVGRGDVLYATVRPYLHNMCIVEKDFSHEPIASTGFAVLAVERGIKNTFLFYYMLSPIFDQYANSSENSRGVAYPAINDDKLYKALIPIPPQNEQQNICKLIDKCFNVFMLKDEG